MINHVTYKIAQKLQKLGYDGSYFAWIDEDEDVMLSEDAALVDGIPAPLWQELWYWLETKGYPTVIASNFYVLSVKEQEEVVLENILSDKNCKKFLKYENQA